MLVPPPLRVQQSPVRQGLVIIEALQSSSDTPHSVGFLWMRDQPTQRPLPANTRYSQDTDTHEHGGIRKHNTRKQADADKRGHRGRPNLFTYVTKFSMVEKISYGIFTIEVICRNLSEGTEENHRKFTCDNWCSDRNSNQEHRD